VSATLYGGPTLTIHDLDAPPNAREEERLNALALQIVLERPEAVDELEELEKISPEIAAARARQIVADE
jgi:hypothetical protein